MLSLVHPLDFKLKRYCSSYSCLKLRSEMLNFHFPIPISEACSPLKYPKIQYKLQWKLCTSALTTCVQFCGYCIQKPITNCTIKCYKLAHPLYRPHHFNYPCVQYTPHLVHIAVQPCHTWYTLQYNHVTPCTLCGTRCIQLCIGKLYRRASIGEFAGSTSLHYSQCEQSTGGLVSGWWSCKGYWWACRSCKGNGRRIVRGGCAVVAA